MSETDRDVLALLDRAAANGPPLHLDRGSVVGRGQQIARRRRAGRFGMAIGGLALAGAVWLGPGPGGLLGPTSTVQPAATTAPETAEQHPRQGPVGEGGRVTLLGEEYEVAVDPYGWPQLLEVDGSVFLRVSDPDGPPRGSGGGGIVMWREHWWPWSDRHEVHFSYATDGTPTLGPGVRGQDAVTIIGPEGEISLVAVPAGS